MKLSQVVVDFVLLAYGFVQLHAAANSTAQIREGMARLREAELRYDAIAAANLLANDFDLSAADGKMYNKQEFLRIVGDRSNPLEIFDYGDMTIRINGNTAIVVVQLHEKGMMNGKPFELNGRPMFVWTFHDGKWFCLGAHD